MAKSPRSKLLTARRATWFLAVAAALTLVIWTPTRPEATPAPAAAAPDAESENLNTAFEPSDWPLAPVAIVYVGALALLVVCCFVLMAAFPKALPDVSRDVRISPSGPLLQTDPRGDLLAFRSEEDRRLNSYYWVDRSKGIVHIPIEQAMQQLATSGIAGFPKGSP